MICNMDFFLLWQSNFFSLKGLHHAAGDASVCLTRQWASRWQLLQINFNFSRNQLKCALLVCQLSRCFADLIIPLIDVYMFFFFFFTVPLIIGEYCIQLHE